MGWCRGCSLMEPNKQPTDRSSVLVQWVGQRLASLLPACLAYFHNHLCLILHRLERPVCRSSHRWSLSVSTRAMDYTRSPEIVLMLGRFAWHDGAKPALRTARSQKAERCFLDVSLPWGQQVAVMIQILSALVLDVPVAA